MADLPPDWRDHEDRPADVPEVPTTGSPFYEPIGDFQGSTYRHNAFAAGTAAEVAALRDVLGLAPGQVLLDVGCGDGRHLRALAADGIRGIGVDISAGLLRAAAEHASSQGRAVAGVSWVRADARALPLADATVDAAMSLCQGGLGTGPQADRAVLAGLSRVVRPGGAVVFTAFHALFAVRHLVDGDAYDTVHGVHHHVAEVLGPERQARRFDLWSSAYTVSEARLLVEAAGLEVLAVTGVEPGRYAGTGVGLDDPELLVVARRPVSAPAGG